ncbi:MAG: serine/threonine-protein kinase, partial [Planctomycetia bacterium]
MKEGTILRHALLLRDPTKQADFLRDACGPDTGLRRRVEDLIADFNAANGSNPDAFPENGVATDAMKTPAPMTWVHGLPPVTPPPARPIDSRPIDRTNVQGPPSSDPTPLLTRGLDHRGLKRLGRHRLLKVLGKGGFGIVYRAFDEELHRFVALKVLLPEAPIDGPARRRFVREARATGKLRHDNIVQVYGFSSEPLPYLVMEFVPGPNLQSHLARTGPMKAADVARVGAQIARGLSAAHAVGIIHRDIKPANILVDSVDELTVKISDFGLARAADDDGSLTQSGMVAGTPLYMAPEQANGVPLDHRADLFSLGSVLYT